MTFKCRVFNHKWNGCVCEKCGATRHAFEEGALTCKKCGVHRCDALGHHFISNPHRRRTHTCTRCGLEEPCEFSCTHSDESAWEWRTDLPDIYVERYVTTYTCTKCGFSYSETSSCREHA